MGPTRESLSGRLGCWTWPGNTLPLFGTSSLRRGAKAAHFAICMVSSSHLKAAASPAHHGAPRGLHLTPRRYLQPNTRVLAWPLGLLDFEQHITERACSHASQRWRHGRGAAGLPWAHRPNGLRPAGSKRCNSLPWKLPGRGAKMGENTNCLAKVVSTN